MAAKDITKNTDKDWVPTQQQGDDDVALESSIRVVDEELGAVLDHDAMDDSLLTLPPGESLGSIPGTPRTVPGGCAICLCPYNDGDKVTWSCKDSCPHAFHEECIIPWLAKNNDPKCPCCRQEFCTIEPISDPTHPLSFLTPFGLVPTAVATPVRQIPFFIRGPMRLPVSTTDLILAPRISQQTTATGTVIPQINLSHPFPTTSRRGITTESQSNTTIPDAIVERANNNDDEHEHEPSTTIDVMPVEDEEHDDSSDHHHDMDDDDDSDHDTACSQES